MISTVKGFTLIEVLIAIFIIGVSLMGLAIGFSSGLVWIEEVKETSRANRVVQEKMEEIRGIDPKDIKSKPETPIDDDKGLNDATYDINVAPVPGISNGISMVTVTVQWTSHSGREQSCSLVTYVTKEGINKQ